MAQYRRRQDVTGNLDITANRGSTRTRCDRGRIVKTGPQRAGSGSGYGYFNDRFNDQSELVTGLVVHESKSEGITFYYNIDYRFDSSS